MKNEPNPPIWPDSVKVIRPDDDKETILSTLKETQDHWNGESFTCKHHFSQRRIALLFAPGVYRDIDFQVGYYVQLLGLGTHPDHVKFQDCGPYVPALNKHQSEFGISLDTFWRSAENFSTTSNMLWAVSQAAPLRRAHVGGDLLLYDSAAYASGGFMANCQVDGKTDFGGQQQWLSRNCHFGEDVEGGAWSLVFCGCSGKVPQEDMGTIQSASISVQPKTPVLMEKPFIVMKDDGIQYELHVPRAFRDYLHFGSKFDSEHEDDVRDFTRVFVARADEDDITKKTQRALDDGKDVVLAPGTFHLDKSLQIKHSNQVILGIGLATLKSPPGGLPCITVPPKLVGVRIAGVMLEASQLNGDPTEGSSLLEWGGRSVKDAGNAENPGGLFDIFCRVGGDTKGDRTQYHVECIMNIHSGNVIGDNLWLWRADHAELLEGEEPNFPPIPTYHQSEEDEFRTNNGICVTGDDVTIYGLAVEHTNEHQTIWSGERGQVYFYQCELPYGVRQGSFGDKGYVGYLVEDHVVDHKVIAPGVYTNFRNEKVVVDTAIKHPNRETIICSNPFTVHLDNNGCIKSIVNGKGKAAELKGTPIRL